MKEKYYIVHYPSSWGMGSNTDIRLVSRTNLRKIIVLEIGKKNSGAHYCDRFTGTWNEEKMPESEDIEEIIEDVIGKRLNTCSTYAGLPDLIELPDSVSVEIIHEKMENIIFRTCNEWSYIRDVIVGKAYITRYRVDLTDYTGELGLENGRYYEFVEYDFKRVAENHHSDTADGLLEIMRDKLARMESKLKGEPANYEGKYIDDWIPEIGTPEYYSQNIRITQDVIAKFSDLPRVEDEYIKHIYKQDYGIFSEIFFEQELKDKDIDYTKQVFDYPLVREKFACEITGNSQADSYITYSELFFKGNDIHYLMADLADEADSMDEFAEEPKMFLAMLSVFGYS